MIVPPSSSDLSDDEVEEAIWTIFKEVVWSRLDWERAGFAPAEICNRSSKKVRRGVLKNGAAGWQRQVTVLQYRKQGSILSELSVLALLAKDTHGKTCESLVPEIIGVLDWDPSFFIVQEHAVYGTLKSALKAPDLALQLTPQHKLHAARDVASALGYLQSLRIVHADLACQNLLLFDLDRDPSKQVSVKITEFGLALVIAENCTSTTREQAQATRWCSPETVVSNKYSFHSDMWSFGVTLWELFADGATPWVRFDKREDVKIILTEQFQDTLDTPRATLYGRASSSSAVTMSVDFPLPDSCPEHVYEIIMSCLRLEEEARPTAAQAFETFSAPREQLVEAQLEQHVSSKQDHSDASTSEESGYKQDHLDTSRLKGLLP